jgi:hypothetical protein
MSAFLTAIGWTLGILFGLFFGICFLFLFCAALKELFGI